MANKPSEFKHFTPLSCDAVNSRITDFIALFEHCADEMGIDHSNIDVSKVALERIIDRVEKRRVYFHIYHHIEMGELNETALQCFWIVKMLPFHDISNSQHIVNIPFAAYLFFKMIDRWAKEKGKRANITKQIVSDLCYSFYYQDISKEALMRIAESLIIGYECEERPSMPTT